MDVISHNVTRLTTTNDLMQLKLFYTTAVQLPLQFITIAMATTNRFDACIDKANEAYTTTLRTNLTAFHTNPTAASFSAIGPLVAPDYHWDYNGAHSNPAQRPIHPRILRQHLS